MQLRLFNPRNHHNCVAATQKLESAILVSILQFSFIYCFFYLVAVDPESILGSRHEYSLKPGMPDHHISTCTHIFIHSSTPQRNFSINGPPTCMYLNSRRKMENLKETQISIGKPHIDCNSKSGLKPGPGAVRQQCLPLHCCATFLLLFSSCFIYTFLFFKV